MNDANKIIEGLKEAVEVTKCDHNGMVPQPPITINSKMDRFYCPKCHGHFYQLRAVPSHR